MTEELTLLDRCDRCGAAAKAVAPKDDDKVLLFCDHHKKKYENNLFLKNWIINKGLKDD